MIDSTTSATSSTGTSSTSTAQTKYDEQYDTFLQLLTTQLKNQVPTDPLDTNEFTQQVVSYSALEQQIDTNSQISQLIEIISGFISANAISYVGDTVTYAGAATELEDGKAAWEYTNATAGVKGTIEIRDASGQVVKTDKAELSAGKHTYVWDGMTDEDEEAPDGTYSISIDLRNTEDTAISVSTAITDQVDSVDLSGDTPSLIVGKRTISVSDILSVRQGT
ncbi:MAG: flagellar hook assembly protein FlgD [Rhodobiaceae bacterium]|nr:flagellar hook assembly protein FlgD [Rhodobiaceae bacterium]